MDDFIKFMNEHVWITSFLGTLIAATIAASVAILFGNRTWRLNLEAQARTAAALDNAQAWKRREYVANWFDRLRQDALAQIALHALDQSGILLSLSLPPEGNNERPFPAEKTEHLVRIGSTATFMALVPHEFIKDRKIQFSAATMRLKNCFDALFARLGEVEAMIEAELITHDEVKPYIGYWVRLLAGERYTVSRQLILQPTTRAPIFPALRLYLDSYGYSDVVKLAKAFGQDLAPRSEDRDVIETTLQKIEGEAETRKNSGVYSPYARTG